MTNKQRLSRRDLFKRTATASLGALAASALHQPAAVRAAPAAPTPPHGAELRGMSLLVKDPTAEGRFGFMFKNQPAFVRDDTLLRSLGTLMQEQPIVGVDLDPMSGAPVTVEQNDEFNENPNPRLTSGFTFLGQFIDHDITFDTTLLDLQLADPDATTNFRTPRYDLDALYGRGPLDDPQLYDPVDRAKFRLATRTGIWDYTNPDTGVTTYGVQDVIADVPRTSEDQAIIADRRNDQHLIIIQLHVAFMHFHNKLVDYLRSLRVPAAGVFEAARQLTRWHYQWLVIHDFLPRIVGQAMADAVYNEGASKQPQITLKYYKPANPSNRAFIPVEFSVAAFRFGHSITRPRYTVRDVYSGSTKLGPVKAVPLFESVPSTNNLNGGRTIPPRMKIQWSKFFNDPTKALPTARPVRQFDTRLAAALFQLPPSAIPDTNPEALLAVRNLLRGRKLGLMSGQKLAQVIGAPVLTNERLANQYVLRAQVQADGSVKVLSEPGEEYDSTLGPLISDVAWGGEAPLWFYLLREAELLGKKRELGPVGGRIVAEVLVGLLQRDRSSYLHINPNWKPFAPIAPRKTGQGKPIFEMYDLLKFAGVWF